MARQIVNIGSSANQGDGDPLRVAFDKINDNFDELYARDLNTDSQTTVYAVDSTLLVDGETGSIVLDGTVKGNIVPDTDVAYDLGSATKRFRDLYLSGSTIDLGGLEISNVGGELQLGGVKVPTQTDLDSAVGVVDGLVAGEGIPDLLTTYTEASLAVDSLLNAGDYGGDLVAPSDYTFYDLVVARRAANPLIPQELELAALLQLNAYNAWQAEISTDKATITVGDYAWNFKGDGNIDGLFEGTGPVSFNNDYLEDGFRGGFTTDKSILQINGANYLNGSDDGGGIIISAGAARNGGNNGDVIISSGGGGAAGTGYISLLADAGISTSGNWIGTQTMDIKGSVFGDDSTTVVDGINGNVTANILTSNTASNFNGTLSVVGVTRLYDDLIIDGGDIVSNNSAYFFGNLECSNITNLQNNEFASDNLTLSAEGSIVLNGNVSLGTVAGQSDFYGEIEFNSGTTTFVAANSVDFLCDVDLNGEVKFAKTTTTGDDDNPTLTLIDVNSSSVQVLTSNGTSTHNWELPDGSEGQIMHFVAGGAGGAGANHKIKINNWWKRDSETGTWSSVTGYWDVFAIYGFGESADTGMATAIFVDGAWRTSSPWVD